MRDEGGTMTIGGKAYRVGRERRVESLAVGTRMLLSSGRAGSLVACNGTRAVLQLDSGASVDVAPGSELRVLEEITGGRDVDAFVTEAPETLAQALLRRAETRHADPAGPSDRPQGRDASGRRCACGMLFNPRRPWQRHCTHGCRQRDYRARQMGRGTPALASSGDSLIP